MLKPAGRINLEDGGVAEVEVEALAPGSEAARPTDEGEFVANMGARARAQCNWRGQLDFPRDDGGLGAEETTDVFVGAEVEGRGKAEKGGNSADRGGLTCAPRGLGFLGSWGGSSRGGGGCDCDGGLRRRGGSWPATDGRDKKLSDGQREGGGRGEETTQMVREVWGPIGEKERRAAIRVGYHVGGNGPIGHCVVKARVATLRVGG